MYLTDRFSMRFESSQADDAAGELEQAEVEVGAYLVADAEAFEPVEPGEGPLHDPARLAQPRAVRNTSTGDHRCDAAGPEDAPVLVVVVAAVGEQPARPVPWPADQAADAGDRVQQWRQLGDVVPVSAGQGDGEGCSVPVDDQVVLAARLRAVDRRRSGVSPPFNALMCEPSIAQSSMSSRPASVQSRSRRQAVTPLQPVRSAGTSLQLTFLRSTYTMPRRAARSSAGRRPGYRWRRGGRGGSSGAIRSHRASGTRSSDTRTTLPPPELIAKPSRRTHSETISQGHCMVAVCPD
ncbi:hypothetical protein QFZ71_000008 [Streptomyces sp. V2I9]|nr:hypothetical protein [Streptomyces sp. V2I9]